MTTNTVTNIVIGVAVVALLVARQTQTWPVRETSSVRIVLVLGVIGVFEIVEAFKGHEVEPGPVEWIASSIVLGGILGAVRALTVNIWRLEDGSALRKGTITTTILWIVSLAVHFAMEVGIDHSTKIDGLGATSLLLPVAGTLGAQREVVRIRAAKLAPGS